MCKQVFVQKYTKSFGGKIWKNLHRVSPYTIFGKKNLQDFILKLFSRQNIHYHIKQKFSNLPNIASWSKVTTIEILLEMLYMACSCKGNMKHFPLNLAKRLISNFFVYFLEGKPFLIVIFHIAQFYDGKLSLIFKNFNGKIWIVFHAAFQNTLTIYFLRFVAVSQENYWGQKLSPN